MIFLGVRKNNLLQIQTTFVLHYGVDRLNTEFAADRLESEVR